MHDLAQKAKRNLKKGLGKRSLNELLALHFAALALVALAWGATTWTGPAGLHEAFRKASMFYAFFGWVALRIWNQHAWRKHFRPRTTTARSAKAKSVA